MVQRTNLDVELVFESSGGGGRMGVAVAPPNAALDRAAVALAQFDAALSALAAVDLSDLGDRASAEFLKALGRGKSRLSSVELRILASADAAGTARRAGASTTDAWAAGLLKADQAPMARQLKLANGLTSNIATREALADGRIDAEKAAVIVDAGAKLPPGLTDAERRRVESRLLAKAPAVSPRRLRQVARRALEAIRPPEVVDAHENDQLVAEEEAAMSRARLTLHDNDDGTVTGHFTVPSLAGGMLKKILDSMCAPRRQAMREASTDFDGSLDWGRLRGMAFVELLEHLPTDHLHGAVASTVVVTLAQDALLGAVRAATTDLDHTVSVGEARRIACGAGILPAVLDGDSIPVDLGRQRRLFTNTQRTALATRHTTCAASGCERPYAWCELHHRQPWSRGGLTDLAKAVPLCGFHHRQIHQHPERVEIRRT